MRLFSDFPVWLIPLIFIVIIIIAIYLISRADGPKRFLIVLRSLIVLSLLLLLWNPILQWQRNLLRNPRIGVWVDRSLSMRDSDILTFKTVFNQADLVDFIFRDVNTGSVISSDDLKPLQNFTDLSKLEKPFPGVDAVWLLSDGNANLGRKDIDLRKVALNVVGVGDTTRMGDLGIADIIAPAKMIVNERDTLLVYIQAKGFADSETGIISVQSGGQRIHSRRFSVSSNSDLEIRIPLKFKRKGLKRLTIDIRGRSRDVNLLNNKQRVNVNVLTAKKTIYLLAGYPVPEIRYLKYFLRDKKDIIIVDFIGPDLKKISDRSALPDMVITFAYPHVNPGAAEIDFWRRASKDRIPLWFFSHEKIYGRAIDKIQIPLKYDKRNSFEMLPMEMTSNGKESEIVNPFFYPNDELDRYFTASPPLVRDFRIYPEEEMAVQIKSLKENNNFGFLMYGQIKNRKCVVIAGWNSYLLHTSAIGKLGEGYWEGVNNALLEWLNIPARSEGIYHNLPDTLVQSNETNEMRISVVDALGNRVTGAEVNVAVDGKNWQFSSLAIPNRQTYHMVLPYMPVGSYKFHISARWGSDFNLERDGSFYTLNPGPELIYTKRNEDFLKHIATGKYIPIEQLTASDFQYEKKIEKEVKRIPFFPKFWILITILLLFISDLVIRKKYQIL